jgi:N-acylglucosamine-6-phosphate 2-epimerase
MSATIVDQLQGGLVVSCQAAPTHPLHQPDVISLLAECAQLGGAVGVRINGADDIRAVKRRATLPIIGLHKLRDAGLRDYITPGFAYATDLARAGADLIAVEVSAEVPGDPLLLVKRIRTELHVPVMADVSTLDDGLRAWDAGAELVGTTLSGYTSASRVETTRPDVKLVRELATHGVRAVAEGRYSTPDDVTDAFAAGAWAVVIGTAITDPVEITRRLVRATPTGEGPRGER